MGLQISLLGSPSVWRDGVRAAPPRGFKTWALLAYLVLSDRPVSRSQAAAVLFPEAADRLAALRWNLHELRRLLGADRTLGGDPMTLVLGPCDVLDVAVIRSGSWQQAVLIAEPDAELLQGISFAGCPAFEAWLAGQRRHLRAVVAAVTHESVAARLAAGQADAAVASAARLVEADPYDEEGQELYLRCLLADGDRAGALRQWRRAVDLIRRDLGAEPGRGLMSLYRMGSPVDDEADADAEGVRAWSDLGLAWLHAGAYEQALTLMRRAVTAARRREDLLLLLRSLLICGYGLSVSSLGTGPQAAIVQHEAMALAARLGEHRLVSVAAAQVAATELLRGRYWRALHWADRAAGCGAGNPVMASRVGTIRGTAMVDTGHVAEGIEELEKAVTGADKRTAAVALCTLGKAHLLRGELDAAEDVLTRAGELARVHLLALLPWPTALRAEVVLRRGRVDRAQELLAQAHALARRFEHSPGWESAAARGLGLVAAARGADDRAVIWLEQAYRRGVRGGLTYRWVRCQVLESLCELAVDCGSPAAPVWLRELEHSAGRWGMHGFVARAGEFRARLGGCAAGSVGECGAEAADHRFGGHRWIGQDDAVPGSVAMVGL